MSVAAARERSHESQIDNAVAFGAKGQPALAPMENILMPALRQKQGSCREPPRT
jgi:hypothetical protein